MIAYPHPLSDLGTSLRHQGRLRHQGHRCGHAIWRKTHGEIHGKSAPKMVNLREITQKWCFFWKSMEFFEDVFFYVRWHGTWDEFFR